MPYDNLVNYVETNLAADVAGYLNAKSANFPNVQNYYSAQTQYFNEHTIQSVMYLFLRAWVNGGVETPNHYLIRSEIVYPGFRNRADLWVTYDDGAGGDVSNLAIELKADFTAASVNEDIEVLDAIISSDNPSIDNGYAFYPVQVGNTGWTDYISDPISPDVSHIPINVIF